MPELASGIDLIEIDRISTAIARHGDRLLDRIFTPAELSEVRHNHASLAARYAAKEAVAKALGTGIGSVGWQEIEILRSPAGQPLLHLSGAAARLAADQGLTNWNISISHTQSHAIALAVACGE